MDRPKGVKDSGPRKKKIVRAGKRKCRRCMEVWNRKRGDKSTICGRCKIHCSRCGVSLLDDNVYERQGERSNHQCIACHNERLAITRDKDLVRDLYLTKKYGITLPEYEVLLAMQDGVCWICEQPPKEKVSRHSNTSKLHVDHRHVKNDKKQNPRETRKRIRGLLCWRCNASLQKFKDDPVLMRKAADFVEQCPAQNYLKEIEYGNS